MSEFATVELVRQWVREHPASASDAHVIDEIRGELARRASGSSAGAWDVGGMCRTLAKRGVPLPAGLGGLTPPTARNWLRGILAVNAAVNADFEITDDALSLAISTEVNRELQLLNGQRGVSVVVASEPAPTAAVGAPTDDEVVASFRLRFREFPTRSAAVQTAVTKWESANHRPFPWPDAEPDASERDKVLDDLRAGTRAEVLDELRVGLRGEVLDELRVGLRGEVLDELRVGLLGEVLDELRVGLRGEVLDELRVGLRREAFDELRREMAVEVRADMLAGAEALLAELRHQAAPSKARGRRAE